MHLSISKSVCQFPLRHLQPDASENTLRVAPQVLHPACGWCKLAERCQFTILPQMRTSVCDCQSMPTASGNQHLEGLSPPEISQCWSASSDGCKVTCCFRYGLGRTHSGGGTQLSLVTAAAWSRHQVDVRANRDTADTMSGTAAGAGECGVIGSLQQVVPKVLTLCN